MEIADFLQNISLYLGLLANGVVAACTFHVWCYRRHRFLMLIAVSGLLGFVGGILFLTWGNFLQYQSGEWYTYAAVASALLAVDYALYMVGIVQAALFVATSEINAKPEEQ
jgi:hypothetical protein